MSIPWLWQPCRRAERDGTKQPRHLVSVLPPGAVLSDRPEHGSAGGPLATVLSADAALGCKPWRRQLCLADDVDLTFCFIPQPAKSERQPTMTTRNGSTAGVSVGRVGSGCSGFVRTGFRVTGHKPEIACFHDDARGSGFYKKDDPRAQLRHHKLVASVKSAQNLS